jgi:hypothetical protein
MLSEFRIITPVNPLRSPSNDIVCVDAGSTVSVSVAPALETVPKIYAEPAPTSDIVDVPVTFIAFVS